jgi:ferrous iron transport protein A
VAQGLAIGYLDAINSHYTSLVTTPAAAELPAEAVVALSDLHVGARGTVAAVREDGAVLDDETGATVVMRLIEIGFVPGERFEIIAESRPGGDPMAVRIGGSCFALRRREASAILVAAEPA